MSWIAVGAAAIGTVGSIYSANKQSKAAKDAAKSTQVNPYTSVESPFGTTMFDPQSRTSYIQAADNPFMNLFGGLGLSSLANAGAASSMPFNGANQQLIDAYTGNVGLGEQDRLGLFGAAGTSNNAGAGYANSMFDAAAMANNSLGPSSDAARNYYEQLRGLAAPEENRQRVNLDNKLFATGQYGSTGGAERLRALYEAQAQADNQRRFDAIGMSNQDAQTKFGNFSNALNFGQGVNNQNFSNLLQSFGFSQGVNNQRFNNALTTVNQGISKQQQDFNMGSAANSNIQNMFAQLLNQAGLNVGAGGGVAPGAATYAASQAGNTGLAVAQAANAFGDLYGRYQASQPPQQAVPYYLQQPSGPATQGFSQPTDQYFNVQGYGL